MVLFWLSWDSQFGNVLLANVRTSENVSVWFGSADQYSLKLNENWCANNIMFLLVLVGLRPGLHRNYWEDYDENFTECSSCPHLKVVKFWERSFNCFDYPFPKSAIF